MRQRVNADSRNVRVVLQIPRGIKAGMAATPFRGAVANVVDERVDTGGGHVGVLLEIPVGVEERVGIASLEASLVEVMQGRLHPCPQVGMISPIEGLVKKSGPEDGLEVGPAPPPCAGRQTEAKPHLPEDQGKPCSQATRIDRAPRRANRIQKGQQSALELFQPLTHLATQGLVRCGTLFGKNAAHRLQLAGFRTLQRGQER